MGPRQVHSREGRQCGGRQKRARPWKKMGAPAVSLQENRELVGEREAAEGMGGDCKGNRMLGGDGGAGGKTADRKGLGRSRSGRRIKLRFWVKIRFKVHWIRSQRITLWREASQGPSSPPASLMWSTWNKVRLQASCWVRDDPEEWSPCRWGPITWANSEDRPLQVGLGRDFSKPCVSRDSALCRSDPPNPLSWTGQTFSRISGLSSPNTLWLKQGVGIAHTAVYTAGPERVSEKDRTLLRSESSHRLH